MNKELTCIFYTANVISNSFANNVRKQLVKAIKDLPLIVVSQKPMERFNGYEGNYKNICMNNMKRSHIGIYRQAYRGVMEAKTPYVAMAEDDILYAPDHFNYTPTDNTFAYDRNIFGLYTWTEPPLFSYKGRRNLSMLVCERDLFIKAMEERFAKYDDDNYPKHLFSEPGKYENRMGVKVNKWEFYYAKEPSIIFSHPNELSYEGLGKRKKMGDNRRGELEYWGKANDMLSYYK